MNDQTTAPEMEQGQIEEPVEEKQVEQMPGSDQQPTEAEEGQLPDEVTERTRKQFEKLTETNKKLAEENAKLKGQGELSSVFDSLFTPKPKAVPPESMSHLNGAQVDSIATKFVDDEGNVNIDALNRALFEANERAKRAEQEALRARQSVMQDKEQREVAEAHAKYPWLDPKSPSFDRQAFELVRDRLVRNMIEGTHRPLVSIAEQVMEVYKPTDVSKAKEQAVQDFKDTQVKKAQASTVQSGRGQPRQENDYSELRERSIRGDITALEERLKAVTSN